MTQDTQLTNREPGVYTLADLFSRADKVVLANVVAGDTASYDIPMYKAEVVAAFKGATNGETIFFGPYIGIRVGTQYFLFLENAPEPIAPKAKSSTGFGTVPYARQVFNEGYTSMQISRQCIFPVTNLRSGAPMPSASAPATSLCRNLSRPSPKRPLTHPPAADGSGRTPSPPRSAISSDPLRSYPTQSQSH